MKKCKKMSSVLIVAVMLAAALASPAMAKELDGIAWTDPNGYVDTYVENDGGRYCYGFPDGSWIEVYDFHSTGLTSPHDVSEIEWLDFIEAYYGGHQYMHTNMRAIPETINGYDYVKITYGPEIDGVYYYDTLYIGGPNCKYAFLASQTSASKPYDAALLAVVQSAVYTAAAPAKDNTIKIYVNGNRIVSDADPVIVSGRTLVPIRAVAEALGCKVDWNSYTRTVRIQKGDLTVDLIVDDTTVLKMRGSAFEEIHADVPAQIINSRTFVPVRVVSEAFGAAVNWDGNTRSVFISQ